MKNFHHQIKDICTCLCIFTNSPKYTIPTHYFTFYFAIRITINVYTIFIWYRKCQSRRYHNNLALTAVETTTVATVKQKNCFSIDNRKQLSCRTIEIWTYHAKGRH